MRNIIVALAVVAISARAEQPAEAINGVCVTVADPVMRRQLRLATEPELGPTATDTFIELLARFCASPETRAAMIMGASFYQRRRRRMQE